MFGWHGKILRVNLTDQSIDIVRPDVDIYHTWVGGKGLAGWYLRPHVSKDWHDPDMPLIFMTGPLNGTISPTSGRMCIMSRSPLTGTICDCSVGGSLAQQIKRAGYDGLIITGKSDKPLGLEIENEKLKLSDAGHLTGRTTDFIYESLKSKGAVASTGPAAENKVLYSSIMVDGDFTAGRGGLGLVMASKNLKYVTARGTGRTRAADPAGLKSARVDVLRQMAASPILLGEQGLTTFGTGALYDLMDSRNMMPTANFGRTRFEEAPSMNAYAFNERYQPKQFGCKGCHVLCKKRADDNTVLPEFETMSHFSALLENSDLETVTKANSICNQLGMDTISVAGTLATYGEIIGRKLAPAEIIDLLTDIGLNRNMGKELSQGSFRLAESRRMPNSSITVKKQELPAYDPRGAYGMALGYVTSTRGGCHLRAYPISHEILRKPVATDRHSFAGKARINKISEDMFAVVDSLVACKFTFFASGLEEYAKVYNAVTGLDVSARDLSQAGERIDYNERIMNSINGFSKRDDTLPERFFSQPGSTVNGRELSPIDRAEFERARDRYYRVRGLDEDGRPTMKKANELGLDF